MLVILFLFFLVIWLDDLVWRKLNLFKYLLFLVRLIAFLPFLQVSDQFSFIYVQEKCSTKQLKLYFSTVFI